MNDLSSYPPVGRIVHRIGVRPESPSTRRTSSASPWASAGAQVSASVTRTTPSSVVNVVSSTFVPGT